MATKKRKRQETAVSISLSTRKTPESIPFLPKEILFNVLCQLPVHALHSLRGQICRGWDEILHDPAFIKTHTRLSLAKNRGVLLFHPGVNNSYQVLESNNNAASEAREDIGVSTSGTFQVPGDVVASSGGVVLRWVRGIVQERDDLYVENPATQQFSKLPCFPSTRCRLDCGFIISLIPNTSEIKVLRYDPGFNCSQWHVITVGNRNSMPWRTTKAPIITPEQRFPTIGLVPFSAGGVVYWASGCWTTESSIMATDLRGETTSVLVRVQYRPSDHQDQGLLYKVVPLGNSACVLALDSSLMSGNVCVLKDLYRSEWEWFYKVGATPELHSRMCFTSKAWLELDDNSQVVLMERVRDGSGYLHLTGYHFKTGEAKTIFTIHSDKGDFLPHVSSLVSW